MPAPSCYSSIRCERIRVTQLDAGGNPVVGAASGYVSDAQVSLDVGLEIEEGEEITQKNGGSRICATSKVANQLKSATLSLELCQLDIELFAMMTGGTLIECATEPLGYKPKALTASTETPVALEVWSRAWDGGGQANLTGGQGTGVAFWHWVFPNVKWTPAQFTLDEQVHVFPLDGIGLENSVLTADGPFNDWPTCVEDAGGINTVYGVWLDTAPPDAQCGVIAVPAQTP
jgi:hypothetical protein